MRQATAGIGTGISRDLNDERKEMPAELAICTQSPALMASQQRLASSLPGFRPYPNLEPGDIEDCEDDVRNEFASL